MVNLILQVNTVTTGNNSSLSQASEIASIIAAVAAVMALIGIGLIFWQVKADHERSRRENVIDLMKSWIDTVLQIKVPRKLVDELDRVQCRKLCDQQEFEVSVENKEVLQAFFKDLIQDYEPVEQNGKIKIDLQQVVLLRQHLSTYLNFAEVVATAWRHEIADRDILEEEFIRIFEPENGRYLLEHYIDLVDAYPSIKELIQHLKSKKRTPSKPPVA